MSRSHSWKKAMLAANPFEITNQPVDPSVTPRYSTLGGLSKGCASSPFQALGKDEFVPLPPHLADNI